MKKKRYKVVGIQPVLEHQPGEIFQAVIPEAQEAFLFAAGALEELPPEKKKG